MGHARKTAALAIEHARRADLGPAIRHAEGHPAPLERAEWDDPDDTNPRARKPWQVAGARRKDGLRAMLGRGTISRAQWYGAEAFRDDLALAAGVRDGADMSGVRAPGFRALEPAEQQVDAQTRVRSAWQAVGITAAGVVGAVVVGYGSLEEYQAEAHVGRERARDWLTGALDRLSKFYEGRIAETS